MNKQLSNENKIMLLMYLYFTAGAILGAVMEFFFLIGLIPSAIVFPVIALFFVVLIIILISPVGRPIIYQILFGFFGFILGYGIMVFLATIPAIADLIGTV